MFSPIFGAMAPVFSILFLFSLAAAEEVTSSSSSSSSSESSSSSLSSSSSAEDFATEEPSVEPSEEEFFEEPAEEFTEAPTEEPHESTEEVGTVLEEEPNHDEIAVGEDEMLECPPRPESPETYLYGLATSEAEQANVSWDADAKTFTISGEELYFVEDLSGVSVSDLLGIELDFFDYESITEEDFVEGESEEEFELPPAPPEYQGLYTIAEERYSTIYDIVEQWTCDAGLWSFVSRSGTETSRTTTEIHWSNSLGWYYDESKEHTWTYTYYVDAPSRATSATYKRNMGSHVVQTWPDSHQTITSVDDKGERTSIESTFIEHPSLGRLEIKNGSSTILVAESNQMMRSSPTSSSTSEKSKEIVTEYTELPMLRLPTIQAAPGTELPADTLFTKRTTTERSSGNRGSAQGAAIPVANALQITVEDFTLADNNGTPALEFYNRAVRKTAKKFSSFGSGSLERDYQEYSHHKSDYRLMGTGAVEGRNAYWKRAVDFKADGSPDGGHFILAREDGFKMRRVTSYRDGRMSRLHCERIPPFNEPASNHVFNIDETGAVESYGGLNVAPQPVTNWNFVVVWSLIEKCKAAENYQGWESVPPHGTELQMYP